MVARKIREILVETDFLFGLNPNDKIHSYVKRAITLHKKGALKCNLAGTALFEFRTVLYSHGLSSTDVYEATLIIAHKLKEYNIDVIPTKPQHILSADFLRTQYPQLSFFDALHAGVAYEESLPLVSYDDIYSEIEEISWIKITEL